MDDAPSTGRVELITGCMFAGKTGELLRRLQHAEYAEQDTRLFKPAADTRYADDHGHATVVTHNGRSQEATTVQRGDEAQIFERGNPAAVVGIDELNLFSDRVVDPITRLADAGCCVIASGLNQTFSGEGFSPVPELMVQADELTQLHAVCVVCGNRATRTQRLVDGRPAAPSDATVKVGGTESYEARCRHCHSVPSE